MVKMLLSSGQISYKESLEHPDRNILVKSLGSKPKLSQGYVQTLSHITPDSFLELEAEDLLILCSDGIWDLISEEYLVNTLNSASTLQSAVNTIIEETVRRGANDNATLLVLRISIASATL
jgi:protein phosphatase